MIILLFNNWNISGCVKLRMLDNKTSSFDVDGDIPDGWDWQLFYGCNGNLNIVDVEKTENGLSVLLTKEMLPIEGTYHFQLKGTKGELVKHTNIVKTYVNKSLSGDIKWPVIPTEFTQIEQVVKGYAESAKESSIKAENAAVHSPIVGENGNWFIWDFEKSEYVDTGRPSSTPPITPNTAGMYLTNDGSKAEWGVPSGGSDLSLGITGATVGQIVKITEVDTDGKPTKWQAVNDRLPNVSPADNGKALYVEQIGEFEYGDGFTKIPDINTFIPLGITDASPGQFAKVKHVDDIGQPTVWEAVDIPSGGSDISLGLTAATVGQTVKVKAVDADGKPTQWEPVDIDSEKLPKFTKLLTHTITEDELAASPIAFVWGTAQIPNLNDFNVFVLTIVRPDGAKIEFNKWVKIKINRTILGNICGTPTGASPTYAITANRLFGVWISGNYYNPKNISIPVLVPPQSSNTYQSNLPVSEPVTSIGFSSHVADYGLTAGVVVEIWGAK